MDANAILTPTLQYGFAGFAAVLLGVVVWLIARLLALLERNNAINAALTQAIADVSKMTHDELVIVRELHDKLLSRPCIAKFTQTEGS